MLLLFENCQMYLPLRVSKLFIKSNAIIITVFAQNCHGLDSDQSFGVIVGHPELEIILLAFSSTFWHPCSKCI